MAGKQQNKPWFKKKGMLAGIFLASAMTLSGCAGDPPALSYTAFTDALEAGQVRAVQIQGNQFVYQTHNGAQRAAYIPQGENFAQLLRDKDVHITEKPAPQEGGGFLQSFGPVLLLLVGIFALQAYMMRRQGGGGMINRFGSSKAKLMTEVQGKVTFADVAGIDEAKAELQEIVEYLRDPGKFNRLGGKIPKGALLVGPPGTGKTLTARAVAGEAAVPFFQTSGSDFVEMFVGVGASRVRDMFAQAKKSAPCIIFIDEIDAVGRQRGGAGPGGGHDEREQTLNQLLVEMDGFEGTEGIIIMAATNRPDVLDKALLRPGRFDRQVTVPNPDIIGREKILAVHSKKMPLSPDVDLKVIARGTPGFSGADLANLCNEAALMAARRDRKMVTHHDFEEAKDKIMMGPEQRQRVMSDREKQLTAYHESGHAILALNMPSCDPVHKATIIPRGQALGMVMQLPESDRYSITNEWMVSRLAVMMGGRVAEEMKFGKDQITSGAQSDIEQATKLARAMVTQWGFSEKLGKVAYGQNETHTFMGMQSSSQKNVSEATARMIDSEVRTLIDEAYKKAHEILSEKNDHWIKLAEGLLEYETLSGREINDLLEHDIVPSREVAPQQSSVPRSGVPTVGRGGGKGPDRPRPDEPPPPVPGA